MVRGQRISIAAICTDGLLALETTSNSVNGEMFFDFVCGELLPEMLPFDGSNPKSIIIMDNHHVQQIADVSCSWNISALLTAI